MICWCVFLLIKRNGLWSKPIFLFDYTVRNFASPWLVCTCVIVWQLLVPHLPVRKCTALGGIRPHATWQSYIFCIALPSGKSSVWWRHFFCYVGRLFFCPNTSVSINSSTNLCMWRVTPMVLLVSVENMNTLFPYLLWCSVVIHFLTQRKPESIF